MRRGILVTAVGAWCGAFALGAHGQVAENPLDPFGIAIPYRLVHLVHATDPTRAGTTAHLRAHDPHLLFALGRDLLHRQYERRHGVGGRPGKLDLPLYVPTSRTVARRHGEPVRFARDHAASCGLCHSSVYREPSAGQTIASTGGLGRNTSHFYGAGLVEMIGEQVTHDVLTRFDRNGNGVIDRAEAGPGTLVRIDPGGGAGPIDFGTLEPDATGVPQLNSAFRLWYVDAGGRVLPDADGLADAGVAGFGFVMQPFGWGRGRVTVDGRRISQGGEATTVREFFTVAADAHMGLQAHDPTQQGADPAAGGFGGRARRSLNGAQQYDFGGSIDQGRRLSPGGVSLDDPDGDGHRSELTEGDVDAVEFYLLHTPAPAVRRLPAAHRGRRLLREVGCVSCHVENWQLHPADARGFQGDRRLFRLEVTDPRGLQGRLVSTSVTEPGGGRRPRAGAATVEAVYSDFKHWDIGPAFHERRFDGTLQTEHRTAPLWGVGNTAPYGHSGAFRDLRSVILAHGGAATPARDAFAALPAAQRAEVIEYLQALVLYSTSDIPSDVTGDGVAATDFRVGGIPVGYERFGAEFLFARRPRYETIGTFVHPSGRPLPRLLIQNIDAAFGLELPYRADADRDGFADVLVSPRTP